jgi:hypothetical protein
MRQGFPQLFEVVKKGDVKYLPAGAEKTTPG